MRSHLMDELSSPSPPRERQENADGEVENISAKMGETFRQFDSHVLAAERELQKWQSPGSAAVNLHDAPEPEPSIDDNEPPIGDMV